VPPLLVPFLAAAGLVALAGWHKLARPAGTTQALRTQGLPSAAALVRLLGAAELAAAAAAFAGLREGALALALLYAGFTGFVLLALLRRRALSSCGCFGRPDTPPSSWHVAVTASAAVCAGLTAAGTSSGVPVLLDAGAAIAPGLLLAAAVVTLLAWALLAELPPVLAAARRRPVVATPAHPARFQITARGAST
jgi:hypothetical protein